MRKVLELLVTSFVEPYLSSRLRVKGTCTPKTPRPPLRPGPLLDGVQDTAPLPSSLIRCGIQSLTYQRFNLIPCHLNRTARRAQVQPRRFALSLLVSTANGVACVLILCSIERSIWLVQSARYVQDYADNHSGEIWKAPSSSDFINRTVKDDTSSGICETCSELILRIQNNKNVTEESLAAASQIAKTCYRRKPGDACSVASQMIASSGAV